MPIDPMTTSAIVGGGTSLLSSFIQAKSQEKANESYLTGVRETNKANRELYEQQVKDARANWAMENNYNSPSSQLSRLRQAGINANDMLSNGNSTAVQSSSAPAMQAPEQTPVPNYGGIISNGVNAAFDTYQRAQQAESSKLALYQKGIETQFFHRAKLNEIRLQEAEILNKEHLNAQDYERLQMLRMDSRYHEKALEQQQAINDETWKNLKKSGREIDSRISRDDAVAAATMRHMTVQEAVDWFNAHTGRQVAQNDARRIANDFSVGISRLYQDWKKFGWQKGVDTRAAKLAENYYQLNSSEKRLARAMMVKQLQMMDLSAEKLEQLMSSPMGYMLRNALGIDPSVIGSATVTAGAALSK